MNRQGEALSLKSLTKSTVWDIQESDVFRLWAQAERNGDVKENWRHYMDVIKSAFIIEEVKTNKPEILAKFEARGCQVAEVHIDEGTSFKWAIKKKPILRTTDLTWENIGHISARKLIEVLERNFGGGWDSLPQSVQDIINSAFDISTTTLPVDRLKKPGGLYHQKLEDGYEVLEVAKGTWVEAIFAKEKPKLELSSTKLKLDEDFDDDRLSDEEDDDLDLNDDDELTEKRKSDDDEDDGFDEDKLTEESYRTTFDTSTDDLDLQASEVNDEEDF
ncbi:MAG: hypothetical protein KH425_01405 [Prevotella bivia]|jgi:hypothetical protein|uniref:hypothetical protein n=1 Tax=Prevotella bivia TaxID=28125 RepID=UPI00254FC112|nr:hypothetical protein [Prevotella bivia]MBS6328240.1 hypothetical protein [Prevotella bivia]MDK7763598.1 hypothetical protein [Prevotella bivia]MDU2113652.1 hypothetical protein [Prevotella bivia]WIL17650.1 hypothetical protein QP022_05210 [Prevotella bivia]